MAYNRLKDLRQQKADLTRELDNLLAKAEQGELSLDEATFGATKAELERVNRLLRTEEERNEEQKSAAAALNQREGVPGGGDEPLLARLRLLQREPYKGRSYEDLFGHPQRANGFKSFDEFLSTIALGQYHPALIHASQQEGVPSAGGFLTPVEYSAMLLNKSLEQEVIRPRAQVVPMMSHTKKVGTFQNDDTSGSAPYGGLSLQWMDESGTLDLTEAKVRQLTSNAKRPACWCRVRLSCWKTARALKSRSPRHSPVVWAGG
jgi:HK97 family phage major capsid protein